MPRVEVKNLGALEGHGDEVTCLSWSPDGRYLASSSYDRTVRVWDVERKSVVRVFRRHRDIVDCVAWSPSGRYLASGSVDRTVRIWNWERGAKRAKIIRDLWSAPSRMIWSYDSRYLAIKAGKVFVYDVRRGRFVSSFRCSHGLMPYYFFWLPNSYRIIGQCGYSVTGYDVVVWDVLSGVVLESFRPGGFEDFRLSSLSPDGRYITLKKGCDLCLFDLRGREVVWCFSSFRPEVAPDYSELTRDDLYTSEPIFFNVASVSWSPDGKFIAVSGADSSLRILDASNGGVLFDTGPQGNLSMVISWSPSGKYIADFAPSFEYREIWLWEVILDH